MNYLEALNYGNKILKSRKIINYNLDSQILLSKVLNLSRERLLINLSNNLETANFNKFKKLVLRRKKKEPIAYIFKNKEFWKYNFKVNRGVLIPRPETEIIVNKTLKLISLNASRKILDIGTGSGEMMLASKKLFERSLGFEPSNELVDFYKQNQIEVFNSNFDFEKIRPFLNKDTTIFYSLCHVLEHNFNPTKLLNDIIINHNKAIIYIEVPLYTGLSFKDQGQNWKLWYDQHYALYSIDTLKFISDKLNMKVLDYGYRTFISDSYTRRINFFRFIKHPIRFLKTFVNYFFNNKNTFMDIFLKDYGYIIISK